MRFCCGRGIAAGRPANCRGTMETYGEDDDAADWITAGILYVCVEEMDEIDRRKYGLPQGAAKLITPVKGVCLGDFSMENV